VLLATVEQVAARVGESIEAEDEVALAEAMIEYASEQALHYGRASWTAESVPGVVRQVVISAAAAGYQHPAGFESERADSVSFQVNADWLRGAEFTDRQVQIVQQAARTHGRVRSLQTSRGNRFVARSDGGRRPWFMKVPHVPEEDVPVVGRLDAFAFNWAGDPDGFE